MAEQIVWLIPALHWLAACWIAVGYLLGLHRGETGEGRTAGVATLAGLLSAMLSLALGLAALWQGAPGQRHLGSWFSSGVYAFPLDFTLDPFALSLLILVSLIGLLGLRFSVNYLHREAGFHRFFLLLCLFIGAMELIVTAGNSLLLFVGWELAGVSSFLLIGYAIERPTATRNGVRVFVTNRIGDAGFVLAIALSLFWLQGLDWPTLEARAGGIGSLAAGVIGGGFVVAALAKSAQLPFAPWIARALEGPTPSSALFYGSLMVHAGVVLLIRLEPLLRQAPLVMFLLAVLGGLTVIYGWLAGWVQSDIKSSLMFATTTQVGWMFLWCGLGWFTLAAWHLGLHALWRAFQFLISPGLLHWAVGRARPLPGWLTRRPWLLQALLQRFYLDSLADVLLLRPTLSLARDVQYFDEQVVTRAVGLPLYSRSLSSLAQWEARKQQGEADEAAHLGFATGLAGRLMSWLGERFHWFESRLVLRGGGEGLILQLHRLGRLLMRIEGLLSEPRYLILAIVLTFVVIL